MPKFLRFFLTGLLGLILLILGGAVFLVRPLNKSISTVNTVLPDTLAAVQTAGQKIADTKPQPLHAGWAKREITPDFKTSLAGYGARRGAVSSGIESPIWCKTLALRAGERTLLLVSLDLLLIPENLGKELKEIFSSYTGLPEESLFLSATHTHSAPNPWDNRLAEIVTGGKYLQEFGDLIKKSVIESTTEALNSMEPAEFSSGRIWAPDTVRNRVRDAPIDAWLEWIAVKRTGDGQICLVSNYSAHATVLGSSNMKLDADYPGYFVSALELRENIEMAMFQSGAIGSAGPARFTGENSPRGFDRARKIGALLAEKIPRLDHESITWEEKIALNAAVAKIKLPCLQVRIPGSGLILAPWLVRRAGFSTTADLHVARIGDTFLVGMPVEFSAEISKTEKAAFFQKTGENLLIASNSTGFYGYLTPDKLYSAIDEKGRPYYESGQMAFLGPFAEYYFRSIIAVLAEAVLNPS